MFVVFLKFLYIGYCSDIAAMPSDVRKGLALPIGCSVTTGLRPTLDNEQNDRGKAPSNQTADGRASPSAPQAAQPPEQSVLIAKASTL